MIFYQPDARCVLIRVAFQFRLVIHPFFLQWLVRHLLSFVPQGHQSLVANGFLIQPEFAEQCLPLTLDFGDRTLTLSGLLFALVEPLVAVQDGFLSLCAIVLHALKV